jgi:hypothetical protein
MELSAPRGESASAYRTSVAWESPGQGGHRHTIPPACGIDDGGDKSRRRGERADAVGAHVAEIGSPMADGSGSVLSRRP